MDNLKMANGNVITNMYKNKEKLLILGLTGRTGAGCSTVASILSKPIDELSLEYEARPENVTADKYKYEIIINYMRKDRWYPFTVMEGSCAILSFVFEELKNSESFITFLQNLQNDEGSRKIIIDNFNQLKCDIEGISYIFKEASKYNSVELENYLSSPKDNKEKILDYYNYYISRLPKVRTQIKTLLQKHRCSIKATQKLIDGPESNYDLYTYLFQTFGNNIRRSSKATDFSEDKNHYDALAKRIDLWIDMIRNYDESTGRQCTRICIDAIRNPYESQYLKDKHRSYYLLSISTNETNRTKQLSRLNDDERINIDKAEYSTSISPLEKFYRQDINACFEVADIHIFNEEDPKRFQFTTLQLLKYICLMIHPGLVSPTRLERCMQLAYNTKFNSGCISRQVGAVITDSHYSIKAVGWNDIPEGQMSCNVRNIDNCQKGTRKNCFSQFEKTDNDFQNAIQTLATSINKNKLEGRNYSYCFKDVYNCVTGKSNQVHTRALHAEENAFLQLSKYGGQGIESGILFSTASPCELCSKKAYQLGIKQIYYIDPYPGISEAHILSFGKSKSNPVMKKYYGTIGEAYISLYKPILSYKDELQLISGVDVKQCLTTKTVASEMQPLDVQYLSNEITCQFISRYEIEATRHVAFEMKADKTINKLLRHFTWTGSTYSHTEKISGNLPFTVNNLPDTHPPYRYEIAFDNPLKQGDTVEYSLKTYCTDESQIMHPYVSYYVRNPTNKLIIKIILPPKCEFFKNPVPKRYADRKMSLQYNEPNPNFENHSDVDNWVLTYTIDHPVLFYWYGIEWEWDTVIN